MRTSFESSRQKHFDVKTEHSIGDVPLDQRTDGDPAGFAARARSNFVIESPNLPRKRATFENYRAQKVFERLLAWLRSKASARKNRSTNCEKNPARW